jgi:hypothetical protein
MGIMKSSEQSGGEVAAGRAARWNGDNEKQRAEQRGGSSGEVAGEVVCCGRLTSSLVFDTRRS